MSEERSFKIIEGEDQTPIRDLTEPTSTLHVIWEEVEAGGRGFRGESSLSRFPLRDEEARGGAIENLPTNLTAIPLYGGNRIEWKEGSNTVLFRGRIGIKDYSRGRQAGGRAREIVLTASDMNYDLRKIIVDGWDRPQETDVARVQALVTTYLSGSPRRTTNINANYVATGSNTVTLPAKVYDATDPATILAEIASIANKQHFVTIDQELFYDGNDSTAYQAGLRISDRLDELDMDGTCGGGTPEFVTSDSGLNAGAILTFSGLVDSMILIVLTGRSDGGDITAVTWHPDIQNQGVNTQAFTKVAGSEVNGTGLVHSEWWYLLNPTAAPSPGSGLAVCTGGTDVDHGAFVFQHVNQTTPVSGFVSSNGTGDGWTLTIAANSSQIPVDAVATWTNNAHPTADPTANSTEAWSDFEYTTNPGTRDKEFRGGYGATSVVGDFGNTEDDEFWLATGMAINVAGAGASGPTFPPIWDVGPASIEDGLQFLSGLRLYYGQGSNTYVYVNNPVVANKAWHAEESLYVNDDAIDTAAKATTLANTLLFRREYDERIHNCSIGPLTTEQVGCIKPGQLIQIKAYPIPNADDAFISVRIAQLMWSTPVPGIFFAHLQLESTLREQAQSIGPKSATDSINRHVEQGSNSHPEYVLRGTLTTQGDLPYRGASDWTRLALGASNTHLISDGVTPKWVLNQSGGSGMTNPMTTLGDIIKGGTSGSPERLGIGGSNSRLGSDGSSPLWVPHEMVAAGSGVTITRTQSGQLVTATIAVTGGGGTTSPFWWHSDNAPASPDSANREFTSALSDTRVSHGTPKGTWAVVNEGAEFTQTASGATDLDVWAISRTISVGDYVTIAYSHSRLNPLLGAFVGFSDGTTFGTSDAVGNSGHPSAGIYRVMLNDWANFNSRLSDGTVFDHELCAPGVVVGVRVKYEAANTWGLYVRGPIGSWRAIQTNYAKTLTPTHVLFGVDMINSPALVAGAGVRIECFRVND